MPHPPERAVLPEILDALDPGDPRARRARRDLRRVHRAMGSLTILRSAIGRLSLARPPRRVLELGAGDGSLLLRFARECGPTWSGTDLVLLDRFDLLEARTRADYAALGWNVRVECADVREWALRATDAHWDLCVTTLFLHHFDAPALATLLRAVAMRADAFVACEPRRALVAQLGSRLVGLLGSNAVTREDAVTSVLAGFRGAELTAAWSGVPGRWRVAEYAAGAFTHCFVAARDASSR